jgi:predicted GIY-YIG superfamily endonuclease
MVACVCQQEITYTGYEASTQYHVAAHKNKVHKKFIKYKVRIKSRVVFWMHFSCVQ